MYPFRGKGNPYNKAYRKTCTCVAKTNVLYSLSDEKQQLEIVTKECDVMKEKYEAPVMEVIMFASEDIITTSGIIVGPDPDVPDTGVGFE